MTAVGQVHLARRVHPALWVGVLFIPFIFVWFLLGKGHSTRTRWLAFGYFALWIVFGMISNRNQPTAAPPVELSNAAPLASEEPIPRTDRAPASPNTTAPDDSQPLVPGGTRSIAQKKLSDVYASQYAETAREAESNNMQCITNIVDGMPPTTTRGQVIEIALGRCKRLLQVADADRQKVDPEFPRYTDSDEITLIRNIIEQETRGNNSQ